MSTIKPTYYVCHPDNTYSAADQQPTIQPVNEISNDDKACVEDDGCPTELAVLQRFWREALAEPVKQEPIGYVIEDDQSYTGSMIYANKSCDEMLPVYIAPVSAKREFVDLTDDEIDEAEYELDSNLGWREWLREHAHAVIAAFKEKNK